MGLGVGYAGPMMSQQSGADTQIDHCEPSPLRGLMIAAPIAVLLWAGVAELISLIV